MLRHITRRAYSYVYTPHLYLKLLKRLQSNNSLSVIKRHPFDASDSQDTTELQKRANNTRQSLTQLCIGNTNILITLARISVAKATLCRI